MTLKEAMEKCVRERNVVMAVHVSDTLQFKFGMNYEQGYEYVRKHTGGTLELAAWDEMLYEGEREIHQG